MVRTIAMESTDDDLVCRVLDWVVNLYQLGKKLWDVSSSVLGDTIDLEAPFGEDAERQPIHKKAPAFDDCPALFNSRSRDQGYRPSCPLP